MTTRRTRIAEPAKLANGEYLAQPREKTLLSAAENGHSCIWPEARMVVTGDQAVFYQGSKKEGSTGLGLAIADSICKLQHLTLRYYFEKDEHCFELRKNNFTTDYAD